MSASKAISTVAVPGWWSCHLTGAAEARTSISMVATRHNAERRQYWDQLVPVNGPKLRLGEKGEHANVFSQRGLSVRGDKLNPWSITESILLAH
jgi:hypothetical protein